MNQYGVQDKVWLVKSSGKILGPFSLEEMKFLLERRKISIIDEIRDPKNRWSFVRENPKFARIVESLREEEARFLDNTTEVDGQKTKTITSTDELTPTPQPDKPKTPPAPPPEQKAKPLPVRESTELETKLVENIKASTNWGPLVIGMLLIVLAIGGYFLVAKDSSPTKAINSEDLLKMARVHKNLGLYEKALGFYKRAASQSAIDSNSIVQMSVLLLEVNSQTQEARKMLEGLLPKLNVTDALKVEAELALGISYLREAKYNQAEDIFRMILMAKENHKEARLNLGISKMLRSDFDGALKELKRTGAEGIAVIARATAQLGNAQRSGESVRMKSTIDDIDRYINSNSEYRLEGLLLKSVLQFMLNDKDASLKTLKVLLDEDPFLTQDHIHNLLVDREFATWQRLARYCDLLEGGFGDNPTAKALAGFCYAQKLDLVSALNKLEDGRKQQPKSVALKAQTAFLLYRLKRAPESMSLATESESDSVLSQRVLAMNCEEQQNWDCADQKWRHILIGNGQDLGALRGLADYQLLKNHRDQAAEFVRRGLEISDNYRPLLEIKEKIDAP